jgi:alanyl-tRNA synthetase
MQQHTGQHILSAAFEQIIGAQTVGFHLGAQSSTIDVDQGDLVMEDVLPVEARANEVVWDDRLIDVELLDGDALAGTGIEPPPDVDGPVRLVKIAGNGSSDGPPLDINPCGGTHVARTGEIGLVKIVSLEHRGEDTRIEFLCGGRALRDYRAKLEVTSTLGRKLTVGTWELDQAVDRIQAENKTLKREQRDLRQRLLDLEAEHLVNQASSCGDFRFVGEVWEDRSPDELRSLALKIAERSRHVALLFSVTDRTHYCFARAEDVDLDVNRLLQQACSRLDGKGGGRPHIAQGSAPRAATGEVRDILEDLEAELGSAA